MTVEYRAMQPGDLDAQRELFRLSFPETAGTPTEGLAHYDWKFRRFPTSTGRASYEYVGAEAGTVAAYYAGIPYRYRVSGRPVVAGMICDVMTHPGYRGKGLFTAIGRFATGELAGEGVAFVTGYPIRPEVLPGHLKVGWRVVQPLPVWLRPVGTRSLAPAPLRVLAPLMDPLLRLATAWARPAAGYTAEILDRERFLADIASSAGYLKLLDRWSEGVPNALEKTADFLAWRTGAPGTRYEFGVLRRDGELVGTALLRATRLKGIECIAVLDLMVDPAHRDGARTLHDAIARHARRSRLDAVACMCSAEWARAYRFGRSGYLRTPATFSLIVKRLTDAVDDADVYDGSRWHVFWVDSDDL